MRAHVISYIFHGAYVSYGILQICRMSKSPIYYTVCRVFRMYSEFPINFMVRMYHMEFYTDFQESEFPIY